MSVPRTAAPAGSASGGGAQTGEEWHTPNASSRATATNPRDYRETHPLLPLQAEEATPEQWSTPQSRDGKGVPSEGFNQANLARDAETWPTPVAHDAASGATPQRLKKRSSVKGSGGLKPDLNTAAETWPTPSAHDAKDSGGEPSQQKGPRNSEMLPIAAANWSTPLALSSRGSNRPGNNRSTARNEALAEGLWQTPTASAEDSGTGRRSGDRSGEPMLKGQAEQTDWPTPVKSDGERGTGIYMRGNPTLGGAAEAQTGHPAPASVSDGPNSPPTILLAPPPFPRRLNACFVESLMGFPRGWSSPHPIGADAWLRWGMRWFRSKRAQLIANSCAEQGSGA